MTFYNNITECIGNTPIVKINKLTSSLKANIYAKLEFFNPSCSVKDRIALSMIEAAEEKQLINKETVIIEPTSGNTGIGLALVCAARGYKLILTMPETMSIERRKILKSFGAQLVLTPGVEGMRGAIEKAQELRKKNKNSYLPQQFENEANPEVHRKTTAMEIWNDMRGKLDIFVAGVGTGGTLTGVGEVLKNKNPKIKIVAVEPAASAVLSGHEAGSHHIQGIGAGFIPKILNRKIIDEIITVKDDDAVNIARRLVKEEGILTGFSGGAALKACMELASRKENANKIIVTILPDTGARYLSTSLFED
ncbi:MAG: cysteine synthase A [Candidatus Margulisbacteria bacterium]|nr:cysteine synthase A [Candidatus Margulisiibacteriota bacterium]